jgi:hypothetical protein
MHVFPLFLPSSLFLSLSSFLSIYWSSLALTTRKEMRVQPGLWVYIMHVSPISLLRENLLPPPWHLTREGKGNQVPLIQATRPRMADEGYKNALSVLPHIIPTPQPISVLNKCCWCLGFGDEARIGWMKGDPLLSKVPWGEMVPISQSSVPIAKGKRKRLTFSSEDIAVVWVGSMWEMSHFPKQLKIWIDLLYETPPYLCKRLLRALVPTYQLSTIINHTSLPYR